MVLLKVLHFVMMLLNKRISFLLANFIGRAFLFFPEIGGFAKYPV